MITFANRASAVLYGFLKGRTFEKPFLLPANVCPVVPLSMMKAGLDYEFVDIDVRHTMSEGKALEKVSSGAYSGLLFVHSYGKSFDNKSFYSELKARSPELCIIDDRCLCKPELEDIVPENVDLVLFSTGYAKYVELSYGGFGITSNPISFEVGGVLLSIQKKRRVVNKYTLKTALRIVSVMNCLLIILGWIVLL